MPGFLDAAKFIAHHPGAVTGIGAGVGTAAGLGHEALRKDDGLPKNYLGAGLRGAAVGGLAGAAVGGIGHVAGSAAKETMRLRPELQGAGEVAKATAQRAGQGLSNFGQRQLHGITGYGSGDSAYLDRIGMGGTHAANKSIEEATRHAEQGLAANFKRVQGIQDPAKQIQELSKHVRTQQPEVYKNLAKQTKSIQAEGATAQRLRDLGLTSVPGAVKGMVHNPREASKALWNQMRGGGGTMATMGAIAPLGFAAHDISKGDESSAGGRTLGQKVIHHGVNVGGGALFAGLPMVSGMVASGAAETGGRRLGSLIARPQPAQSIAPAAM